MTGDLRQFVEGLLLVIAALLPIVNPFGGAPVFLAMTADCTAAFRATLAQKIAVNAFVLLLASLFVGTYVLEFFGLSVPIVQVAGGIVVCANAWELLRAGTHAPVVPHATPAAKEIASRAFYPLTLPLTVGPGTISVAITIGAHHPQSVRSLVVNGAADVIGAVLIAATVFVCYRYAHRMLRMLGETGTSVLIRLSAFILLCIGVQIFWTGASALLASVPR
ncbi:MAG: MarC family protein [Betaproteobacteria bacterium]|jgi:multiple antibiotic resistance protein|nr:MarC family protein [Betaproteobacteria bacterium]